MTADPKPSLAEAHFGLAMAYDQLARYPEAIKAYRQAIRIKPNYAEARCGLGIVYSMMGDKDAARQQYEILKTLDKTLAKKLLSIIQG